MNEQIVLIAIGAVVAAIVLRPLLRGRRRDVGPLADQGQAPAVKSDQLAELELDRAMGRVSDEDYARWRAELDPVAADVSQGKFESDPDRHGEARSKAEALVRQWRERPRARCPNCGERPEPEARFCSNCGTAITR